MSKINRVKKERDFALIDKGFLNSPNLSMKAKGLLAYLLGLPDDWVIYKSELTNHFTDGRDAVRSALEELEAKGYLTQDRGKRDKKGKMLHHDITIYETPIEIPVHDGLSATDYPQRVIRNGKPDTTNINLTNNNLTNNNLTNIKKNERAMIDDLNAENQNQKPNAKPKNEKTLQSLIDQLRQQGYPHVNNMTFLSQLEQEYADYGHDLIARLLEIAVDKQVTSFAYLAKVLKSWDDEGITTIEQLDAKDKPKRKLTLIEQRIQDMRQKERDRA